MTTDITEAERRLINMMITGKTNTEIAAELYVSESTLLRHLQRLMTRVGAPNRLHLIAIATHRGWVDATLLTPEAPAA